MQTAQSDVVIVFCVGLLLLCKRIWCSQTDFFPHIASSLPPALVIITHPSDLLPDFDRAAVYLIHMDTLTFPRMPYLSEDQVIYLGLD